VADFLAQNNVTRLEQLIGIYPRGSRKYAFNNKQSSMLSLGLFGANEGYVEGDWETRKEIEKKHEI